MRPALGSYSILGGSGFGGGTGQETSTSLQGPCLPFSRDPFTHICSIIAIRAICHLFLAYSTATTLSGRR